MDDPKVLSTRRRILKSGRRVTRLKWDNGRIDTRVDTADGRLFHARRRKPVTDADGTWTEVTDRRVPPPVPRTYDLGGES